MKEGPSKMEQECGKKQERWKKRRAKARKIEERDWQIVRKGKKRLKRKETGKGDRQKARIMEKETGKRQEKWKKGTGK